MLETGPATVVTIGTDALTTLAAAGPPADLPGDAPGFVGEIHAAVRAFLDGSVDSLGDTISGLTPGGAGDAPGR